MAYDILEYKINGGLYNMSIYSEEHKHLIQKLKQAREIAQLDQQQVAKLLGKTQSYISKIESGQRKIDIVQIKAFARIYKKEISFFIS